MAHSVYQIKTYNPYFDMDAKKLADRCNMDVEVTLISTKTTFFLKRKKYNWTVSVKTRGYSYGNDEIVDYRNKLEGYR